MELLRTIILSLGSNADWLHGGESAAVRIDDAINCVAFTVPGIDITSVCRLASTVPCYRSYPCPPLPAYANAVAVADVKPLLPTSALNDIFKQVEFTLGRRRPAPRVAIDIDIIYDGILCLRKHELGRPYCRLPLMKMLLLGHLIRSPQFITLFLTHLPVDPS